MCVCVCIFFFFFFFSWMRSGVGKQEEWMRMEKSCQWNGNYVWVMCEGWWRVNLEMLLTDCRERGHSYTEAPVDNLGNWAHCYLSISLITWKLLTWPGASETSDLKVAAFLSISLQCKSGYGFCFILAENKIDGFLEKELPGVQEGKVLWAAWFIFI